MTSDPEQLRREIEGTRRELSADVDALTEKINPSLAVKRQMAHVRGSMTDMKDKIMGSAENAVSSAGDTVRAAASGVVERTSSTASEVTDAVSSLPQAAQRQARGNPLAAGLVVFGAGWLVSSLLPTSRKEQQLTNQAKNVVSQQAHPLAQQLGQATSEMAENLRKPAQQAVESVRSTASRATSTLVDEGRSAVEDVTGRVEEAKDTVRDRTLSS